MMIMGKNVWPYIRFWAGEGYDCDYDGALSAFCMSQCWGTCKRYLRVKQFDDSYNI